MYVNGCDKWEKKEVVAMQNLLVAENLSRHSLCRQKVLEKKRFSVLISFPNTDRMTSMLCIVFGHAHYVVKGLRTITSICGSATMLEAHIYIEYIWMV